ncbi:hypothetical protein FACS1894140_2910 [Spirochaetia bacterium]|nr:hypothetical protein FACS1894140_2910 [Spirochaetia bacterium]
MNKIFMVFAAIALSFAMVTCDALNPPLDSLDTPGWEAVELGDILDSSVITALEAELTANLTADTTVKYEKAGNNLRITVTGQAESSVAGTAAADGDLGGPLAGTAGKYATGTVFIALDLDSFIFDIATPPTKVKLTVEGPAIKAQKELAQAAKDAGITLSGGKLVIPSYGGGSKTLFVVGKEGTATFTIENPDPDEGESVTKRVITVKYNIKPE